MNPKKAFTDQQPGNGDTILHCGHLGPDTMAPSRSAHWFKYEEAIRFERPDKSRGAADWLAVCDACFIKHGDKTPVRGDARWTGEAPVIERGEN